MTNEIDTNKPFFIGSCILHAVLLLAFILSVSFSGRAGAPSASQPNIIHAVAVSSSALAQYQHAMVQKQQAAQKVQQMLQAQQAAEQLAQQKAAEQAKAEAEAKLLAQAKALAEAKAQAKAAAMKQSIEKQLKESMEKQLARTPPSTVVSQKVSTDAKATSAKASASGKSVSPSKSAVSANTTPGLADKYKAAIIQAISEQWVVPQHLPKNISCVLTLRVAPGGAVIDVTVKKSSGNPVLDNSAIAAVNKASPLPVPADPNLFDVFRTITLTVKPDGSLLEA